METKTLNFWTTGENMTRLYRDFIQEGNFNLVYQEFANQNMPVEMIQKFFLCQIKLEGDTREEPDLWFEDDNSINHKEVINRITTGIRTLCRYEDAFEKIHDAIDKDFVHLVDSKDVKKNILALYKVFDRKEMTKLMGFEQYLEDYVYNK